MLNPFASYRRPQKRQVALQNFFAIPAAITQGVEHHYLEALRVEFESTGDRAVVVAAVLGAPSAFEERWIAKQITSWRREGNRVALDAVFTAASDLRGRRSQTWSAIRRDLNCLEFLLARVERYSKLEPAVADTRNHWAARGRRLSRSAVVNLRSAYLPYLESVVPGAFRSRERAIQWLREIVPNGPAEDR